ncbi:MAG: sulfite exporter TauE/SafE family protein, partial [Actinomycetota bacterium]|nr:sulfite exporter TauE/SafE family protein [Actinomycetota bacterium]
ALLGVGGHPVANYVFAGAMATGDLNRNHARECTVPPYLEPLPRILWGARLAAFLSEAFQLTLLAVVMLVAAFFVFRENDSDEGEAKDGADEDSPAWAHLGLPALGVTVGMLTGLVGVGGGFLIVPALALLAKTPMKEAVGTSLLVIAMNSASGFLGYLGRVEIQWGLLALFTAVAVAGSFAGTYLARFIPQVALRKVFAIFLVGIATFILYENLGAFF